MSKYLNETSPTTSKEMNNEQAFETSKAPDRKRGYLIAKRILDIVLSGIGIILCILPMLIISLIIKLESPGAAIYSHKRVGKNGKPLSLLKFRSMYTNADEMIQNFTPEQKAEWEENFKLEDDPRVTRIGKFLRRSSLDELPQLINVLKGELSLVGPRPVVSEELEKYEENKAKFLSVTPGLTGYWQAYARSNCSYDCHFVWNPVDCAFVFYENYKYNISYKYFFAI